jgi:hypothetical protein
MPHSAIDLIKPRAILAFVAESPQLFLVARSISAAID